MRKETNLNISMLTAALVVAFKYSLVNRPIIICRHFHNSFYIMTFENNYKTHVNWMAIVKDGLYFKFNCDIFSSIGQEEK